MAQNIYAWMEWIVAKNRELTFCEKPRVRKYTKNNLEIISTETLKIHMGATVEVLENDFKKSLAKKFGIAFDGWSEHGVHYLAVFAVGCGVPNDGVILLGFSPFEQEDDLSSKQHIKYLEGIMPYYGRSISDLIFIVGDNCNTNKKVAKDLKIPLIGCNSHKLNLAVHLYLGSEEDNDKKAKVKCRADQFNRRVLLHKLSSLMSKLKTIKGTAK